MIRSYIWLSLIYHLQMEKYDIAIIGAGCAGLSLAYKLIDSGLTVCVLEKFSRTERIRKTWSYWKNDSHPFDKLESNSYNSLEVRHKDTTQLDCSKYNYVSIDSKDFDDFIIPQLDESANIELVFSSDIKKINKVNTHYNVEVDSKNISVQHIFDSRNESINASLYQVFHGYFIKLNNYKTVTPKLMDFTDSKDFHFFYVLPKDDGSILVESTYFSPKIYDKNEMTDAIKAYIKDNISDDYEIIRTEYGVIPMTSIEPKVYNEINRIGISAGATRSSTGYTFMNIQRHTDYIANHLKKIPTNNPLRTIRWKILRKMDHVLLKIIYNKPSISKDIMFNLFKNNNSNSVIRFLSDTPSITDILKIIFNMPKLIFINYAIRTIFSKKI